MNFLKNHNQILLFLWIILYVKAKNDTFNITFDIVAKWNIIEFDLGDGIIEKCENCMPAGIKISTNLTIFVSFPRWYDNVIATFAKYNNTTNLFEPWPSLEFNQKYKSSDPSGFNSILGFEIDEKDNMYILDQGKINNSPAEPNSIKLVIFNKEGESKGKIIFDEEVADRYSSFLNDIVVDHKNNYSYISDSGISLDGNIKNYKPGIIVVNLTDYSYRRILDNDKTVFPDETFWLHIEGKSVNKDAPMKTGADGIALSCDGKALFFCPLSSRMIYSVLTENIHNYLKDNSINLTVYQGYKKEASDGLLASSNGNLYMTGLETGSIYVAKEVDQDLLRFNFKDFEILRGNKYSMWPDTMSIYNGYLYFITNQLNNFPNSINYTHPENGKYNFAILKFKIDNDDSYIKGCSPSGCDFGVGAIIIWICFAVIILIVLSFVLMGSNNQEEVIDKHMNLGVVKED